MFVLLFCTEFCGKQPQKACLPALSRAEYFLYFYTSIDCFALNFFLKRLLLFFYNAISFPPLFPWILAKGRHLNSHISIYLFKASFCTISWLSSFNVTLWQLLMAFKWWKWGNTIFYRYHFQNCFSFCGRFEYGCGFLTFIYSLHFAFKGCLNISLNLKKV